jgi:beta-barrel assembly-enhancing protease
MGKRHGESILNILAPKERRCENQELQQAIDEIVVRLNTSSPSPYSFKVYIVKSSTVNAIALPGGSIIVFSGLIDKTESPEALAAVLAHEIQHIKLRHVTKKIIEDSSTGLILSALSGDLTGSMMYGISAARTLAVLSYSRQDEEAADDGGMKMMLAANLNPEDMIKLFKTIKDENKNIKIPQYISTHPDLDNRIADLKIITARAKAGGHVYEGL